MVIVTYMPIQMTLVVKTVFGLKDFAFQKEFAVL